MNEVFIPTKIDILGAARGILNIEKSFGTKIEKFEEFIDKSLSLTSEDSRFLGCVEKQILFGQNSSKSVSNDLLQTFCKSSLSNLSNGLINTKCFISNLNLFHFQVEEVWSNKSDNLSIYFIHNFLSDQDVSKFETFKTNVDFNHMSKFYNFDEEHPLLFGDGDLKCRLNGKTSIDFFEGDFERVENNLHFGREGKIAFLPRNPEILIKTEIRFLKQSKRPTCKRQPFTNFETIVNLTKE